MNLKSIAKSVLNDKVIGALDYYRFPQYKESWGGPFNGQKIRQEIFLELFSKINFQKIIETGTYHGTTTEFMYRSTKLPIYSTEADPRAYGYSRLRFLYVTDIKLYNSDSRKLLREFSEEESMKNKTTFFYLDAHWNEDLPLREEIELVLENWPKAVIMVDDFKVPFDSEYTYDDYGNGKELSLEYLEPLRSFGFCPFFPSKSAKEETGRKRGCIVLANKEGLIENLSKVKALRAYKGHE
ncbi:MAG: hypothetical protein HF312_03740 [Ignavibacteria bacterium]|jgi:hypothetical protein|nr:hypothetical protein [Ignavibacteria bacterium]MCU7519301.1 hypothetical protein [Ignavibacteria bacterium]